LSPDGKDFLRCCFRRNPAERPSATMLLEHRWLKNSQQLDVSSTIQSISGIKLTVSYQCHSHSFFFFFSFPFIFTFKMDCGNLDYVSY
jgi:serine/threonine protein kinase